MLVHGEPPKPAASLRQATNLPMDTLFTLVGDPVSQDPSQTYHEIMSLEVFDFDLDRRPSKSKQAMNTIPSSSPFGRTLKISVCSHLQ